MINRRQRLRAIFGSNGVAIEPVRILMAKSYHLA